ncbi:MAG TPA: Trm112 family protein [Candidatus Dormibacteraeota bacterium]
MLVCPRCHGTLVDVDAGLRCDPCRVVYPVKRGVPVLLKEAGRPQGD